MAFITKTHSTDMPITTSDGLITAALYRDVHKLEDEIKELTWKQPEGKLKVLLLCATCGGYKLML